MECDACWTHPCIYTNLWEGPNFVRLHVCIPNQRVNKENRLQLCTVDGNALYAGFCMEYLAHNSAIQQAHGLKNNSIDNASNFLHKWNELVL